MKTTILTMALLFSLSINAQKSASDTIKVHSQDSIVYTMNDVADCLINAQQTNRNSRAVIIIGAAIAGVGVAIFNPPVIIVGGAVVIIGELFSWTAWRGVGSAGRILKIINDKTKI